MARRAVDDWAAASGQTPLIVVDNTMLGPVFQQPITLGGSESLVCHPASTPHSGVPEAAHDIAGVPEGLIRLSVGLEHPDDLISDLEQAFRQAVAGVAQAAE